MKNKNIIWYMRYSNNKWKIKILFDLFISYRNNKWKIKIIFDLFHIVIINEK
jgi:hypothetical protein